MIAKRLFALFGREVTRIWFFTNELFFDSNVIFGFERFRMAREIAVGHTEQLFERTKIGRVIDHQHRHDAEPDPVIKSLVDILYDVFQIVVNRNYPEK